MGLRLVEVVDVLDGGPTPGRLRGGPHRHGPGRAAVGAGRGDRSDRRGGRSELESGPLLGERSLLEGQLAQHVGVVDAAQLLEAVPLVAGVPGQVDQRPVHQHPVQVVVGRDHQQVRQLVGPGIGAGRQVLGERDDLAVVPGQREVGHQPRVTGPEVRGRERDVHRDRLERLVLVVHAVHRPVQLGLGVAGEGEPVGPAVAGRGVVGEGREDPGLGRGRGGQVVRQVTEPLALAGVDHEQRGARHARPGDDPVAGVEECGASTLEHERLSGRQRGAGQPTGREALALLADQGARPVQQVVDLDQHLDREARGEGFEQGHAVRRRQVFGVHPDEVLREELEGVGVDVGDAPLLEQCLVDLLAVATVGLHLRDHERLGQLGGLGEPLAVGLDRLADIGVDEVVELGRRTALGGHEPLGRQHLEEAADPVATRVGEGEAGAVVGEQPGERHGVQLVAELTTEGAGEPLR